MMIISSQQVKGIIQLNRAGYNTKKPAVDMDSSLTTAKADSFVLSGRAQELQFAKEQVLKSPDTRADKIGELKNKIREGNYQVPSNEIAQTMLGRIVADELAGR